jgi:hypothetical protein
MACARDRSLQGRAFPVWIYNDILKLTPDARLLTVGLSDDLDDTWLKGSIAYRKAVIRRWQRKWPYWSSGPITFLRMPLLSILMGLKLLLNVARIGSRMEAWSVRHPLRQLLYPALARRGKWLPASAMGRWFVVPRQWQRVGTGSLCGMYSWYQDGGSYLQFLGGYLPDSVKSLKTACAFGTLGPACTPTPLYDPATNYVQNYWLSYYQQAINPSLITCPPGYHMISLPVISTYWDTTCMAN